MNNKWISEYINEISDTNEDTDLGHTDNEPDMLSSDLSVIARYAAELKDVMDTLSNTNDEIDLPHWWQAKVIKAKDYLIGAKHYLRAELEKNQSNTITSEDYKKKLEERVMELTEKNVPTDSSKWSYYKSQAKKKFDVYPSAYANGWAAKQYKAAGGGWKTENKESVDEATSKYPNFDLDKNIRYQSTSISSGMWRYTGKEQGGKGVYRNLNNNQFLGFSSDDFKYFKKHLKKHFDIDESINEAKSMDMNKRLKVYDKLKKGDEITIKYGSSMSSGREGKFKVTKGKTVVGKEKVERIILQSVANPKGVKFYLYQRNGNVTMAIGDMGATIEDMSESVVNEAKAKSKDTKGIRFAEAVYNNVSAMYGAVVREKKDVTEVVTIMGPVLVNSIKATLKHKFKPTDGNEVKLKDFYSELKDLLKVAESLVKKPSKAGLMKLDKAHTIWWNHKSGAAVVLNGKHTDNIVESVVNEAKEPEVITQLRKIVKDKQNDLIKDTKTGKKVRVDMNSANLMIQVYDALKSQSNKDMFVNGGVVSMGLMAFKLMKKEDVSESGIMYKAGVKKYGKEGMTKIQSAAGKGEGHEEIGKIKDKYDKSKNEAVKPLKASASFSEVIEEGEYQGRKVKLNKPMQGDVKKFKVYVNNEKGNVVKVNFGQKGMVIKKDNPAARKSFRARMNCDNPGPKWKANYWSCKKW